ncbi:lytic murein transglycosylase B [Halarcobacter ebronensis]|uniref:Lytic murein transglycosylase B n=2 Tax=Halarcobacter ebronensis TaxID=1462615 RepID=A0A4Q1AQF4_9BACT|nr:lytic murein transglycosylase B [Halarcobacter ebronensis]
MDYLMKKIFLKLFLIPILSTSIFANNIKDYTKNSEVQEFINELVESYKFEKEKLAKLFSKVKTQEKVLKYYFPTKEIKTNEDLRKLKKTRYGTWDDYEERFIGDERAKSGALFMKKHKKELLKAYKKYGVQPEYITAIIGIESQYGKHTGAYPVFDTLTTLAFEKNSRNKFFKSELKEFLLHTKRNDFNPREIKGSYAGATGMVQFMPSNLKKVAVDFNNDGKVDLNNEADAIGSVANYFYISGWDKKIPVATRVSYQGKRFEKFQTGFKYKYERIELVGIKPRSKNFHYPNKVHLVRLDRIKYDELWYGTKNFYVIGTYNRSTYYAMAVYQLAKKIKSEYKKLI